MTAARRSGMPGPQSNRKTQPAPPRLKQARDPIHLQRAASFSFLAIAFLALAGWSWRKWPDLLVDFGQQLYIPWQLSGGKLLYRDIAFLHGPFSQYFNALWFRIFGPSMTVLVCVNLLIVAGMSFLIYRLVRLFAGRFAASACVASFLSIFAFAQYLGVGNYNWICPYTHESVHGVVLTTAFIVLWSRFITKQKRSALIAGAVCLGLALLTKVDVAAAAAITALCACAAAVPMRKLSLKQGLVFLGSVAAPFGAFFAFFLTRLPLDRAFAAAAGGMSILSREVARNPFYAGVSGMDRIGGNLLYMAGMSALVLTLALAACILDVACRKMRYASAIGIGLGVCVFTLLLVKPELLPWRDLPRALPVLTVLALIVFAVLLFRAKTQADVRFVPMFLLVVMGFALLAKILLNARVAHYGFYLAMPATLVAIVCFLHWVPQTLKSKFRSGEVFRWLSLAVIAAGIVFHLKISDQLFRLKTYPIGSGGDMFLTYPPDVFPASAAADAALRWIDQNVAPDRTFAALPEGIIFNYLSRRRTSVPEVNFMMTELLVFGEGRIVDGFAAHPPDYIMLVHKDSSEFGVGPFGMDANNGKRIMEWVNRNYAPAALIGSEPFQTGSFGIKILKRNPF